MRCRYTLAEPIPDPDHGPNVGGDVPNDWQCPRHAEADSDRCVFHSREPVDPAVVSRRFIVSVTATHGADLFAPDLDRRAFHRESKRFLGATANRIVADEERIGGRDAIPIDLRRAELGELSLDGAVVESSLALDGATVDDVRLHGAALHGDVSASRIDVDRIDGEEIEVGGDLRIRTDACRTLSLPGAEIDGRLTLDNSRTDDDVDLTEAVVGGRFRFKHGTVGGNLVCPGLKLRGENLYSNTSELTLRATTVGGDAIFENARSRGSLLCNDLVVRGDLVFSDAIVDEHLWLGAVDNESTTLGPAEVAGSLRAVRTTVGGDADLAPDDRGSLSGPVVGGVIDCRECRVDGELRLAPALRDTPASAVLLGGAEISSGRIAKPDGDDHVCYDLHGTTVGDVRFRGVDGSVPDRFRLLETRFDDFFFSKSREVFATADWTVHDLFDGGVEALATSHVYGDAALLAGDLLVLHETYPAVRERWKQTTDVDTAGVVAVLEERLDLERVRGPEPVREAALPDPIAAREGEREGAVRQLAAVDVEDAARPIEDVLADDDVADLLASLSPDPTGHATPVRIAGNDYHALASAVARVLADPTVHEPTTDQLETTYLLAKNGANAAGDAAAAAEFFRREMRYRRRNHRETAADTSRPATTRMIAGGYRWPANLLFEATAGYGERPGNVLVVSAGVIGVFTLLYAALVGSPPYGSTLGYAILSVESFVTLILGGAEIIDDPVVRLVASMQGFLGAFLIALFVFTLTRSVDR